MEELALDSRAAMVPHDSKILRGSEDACFIHGNWVGLADGVGGWFKSGVDSGIFARGLMHNCKMLLLEAPVEDPDADLFKLIERATLMTLEPGSATVVLIGLVKDMLYIANFGDSGCLVVIRDGLPLVATTPQVQNSFPNQVSSVKEYDRTPTQDGELLKVELRAGDIVLCGSDGLFDNLSNSLIARVCTEAIGGGPELAANLLILLAKYQGPKQDDITAVVSVAGPALAGLPNQRPTCWPEMLMRFVSDPRQLSRVFYEMLWRGHSHIALRPAAK